MSSRHEAGVVSMARPPRSELIKQHAASSVLSSAAPWSTSGQNEKTVDARGYAKRSKVKANLVPTGKLGALVLTQYHDDMKTRLLHTFEVGSGFTDEQRIALWQDRKRLKGRLVTVEYREMTKDNVPRFPVFKGFRHASDMS